MEGGRPNWLENEFIRRGGLRAWTRLYAHKGGGMNFSFSVVSAPQSGAATLGAPVFARCFVLAATMGRGERKSQSSLGARQRLARSNFTSHRHELSGKIFKNCSCKWRFRCYFNLDAQTGDTRRAPNDGVMLKTM